MMLLPARRKIVQRSAYGEKRASEWSQCFVVSISSTQDRKRDHGSDALEAKIRQDDEYRYDEIQRIVECERRLRFQEIFLKSI